MRLKSAVARKAKATALFLIREVIKRQMVLVLPPSVANRFKCRNYKRFMTATDKIAYVALSQKVKGIGNMAKDTQSRKFFLTINNPKNKYTHKIINEIINKKFPSILYYCIADEIGLENQTYHSHMYLCFSGGVRFSTIKKCFPTAHIETAHGTSKENRDYIGKLGKWENDEKHGTKVEGTFEEHGELPKERMVAGGSIESIIIHRILEGANNAEILLEFPYYLRGIRDVEYVRQALKNEEYREKWRDIETTYIWGKTNVGKTRYVMDGFGYSNVYAVNNYKHPFDGYSGEMVMLFDEFNSQFRIQDMNNYLDGYPISLPARYSNKQACFEKVFIISNIDLREQYHHERVNQPDVYDAFLRRIKTVMKFSPDGTRKKYTVSEYMNGFVDADIPTPWDDVNNKGG
jgi:hypothetical protein